MRKTIRRIVCMTAALLVLFSLAPAPARAVDPVSAATMANALAQAITAYGASNGVSMMYDVTDTNGIGEAVNELWEQFKADIDDNDVPTYDSLAVTTWSTIFKKVGNNVAINLSDTTVSYLDRFWNWLLSGPAEMQKVDDQYYQWTVNQSGTVDPIKVIGLGVFYNQPLPYHSGSLSGNYYRKQLYIGTSYSVSGADVYAYTATNNASVFAFNVSNITYFVSPGQNTFAYYAINSSDTVLQSGSGKTNQTVYYSNMYYAEMRDLLLGVDIPVYDDLRSGLTAVTNAHNGNDPDIDSLSVMPYVGDAVPQDVYIPDNDDVNYQPLPYVGPLNIPWQNAWGDGETIDDAGAQDIADALDQQIVDDGTLELESDNTVNPPIDDVIGGPDDYQVPGLADVFPFCIPFDIYNFLSALAADPVAPHFTAQLDFPEAIGGTQNIDIDFDSPTWNQLAQLLRLLELLAFIVGLALLTRSMFIRG